MADTRIPMDQRNPFAPWGFEEVKYGVEASEDGSIVELDNNGFEGQLTNDNMYNEIAVNNNYEANPQESFFTNNDTQKYEPVATHAYGFKKELQPEREAGEPLNYYGIQAVDLKLYETEESEGEDEDDGDNNSDGGNGENETPTNNTNTSESGSTDNSGNTENQSESTDTTTTEEPNGSEPNGEEPGDGNNGTE